MIHINEGLFCEYCEIWYETIGDFIDHLDIKGDCPYLYLLITLDEKKYD